MPKTVRTEIKFGYELTMSVVLGHCQTAERRIWNFTHVMQRLTRPCPWLHVIPQDPIPRQERFFPSLGKHFFRRGCRRLDIRRHPRVTGDGGVYARTRRCTHACTHGVACIDGAGSVCGVVATTLCISHDYKVSGELVARLQ